MRPFRSILLMKVSMNRAIDCAFAFRMPPDRVELLGTRPLMAGAAIGMPWDPGPTRPSELGVAVSVMGYHGITWASMGIGRNTLENLGFFGFSRIPAQSRVNGINCLQIVLKVEMDQGFESRRFNALECSL